MSADSYRNAKNPEDNLELFACSDGWMRCVLVADMEAPVGPPCLNHLHARSSHADLDLKWRYMCDHNNCSSLSYLDVSSCDRLTDID